MTKRELIGECDRLRNHIEARGWASGNEINGYYPKGGQSASKDKWWLYRGQLMRFMGRAEWHQSRKEEAEEEVLKALREEPVNVTLIDGETTLEVHPKSFESLLWFRNKEFLLDFLNIRIEALRQAITEGTLTPEQVPEPAKLMEDGERELGFQFATLCFAACQPGPSIDIEATRNPPEVYRTLHPLDIVRITGAFQEVNARRLTPIPLLIGPRKANGDGAPTGWNVFFATTAKHYKVDVRDLMRDRSLVNLLAQVQLAQPTDLDS